MTGPTQNGTVSDDIGDDVVMKEDSAQCMSPEEQEEDHNEEGTT